MNLIDTFVKSLENEEAKIDLKDILTKDKDIYLWEKFVDIYSNIELEADPGGVGGGQLINEVTLSGRELALEVGVQS